MTKLSSPRTWGCFWTFCRIAGCCRVFPTHVGVFLHEFNTGRPGSGLPHARGGVSIKTDTSYLAQRSSPRTWGCFLEGWGAICACVVFPTHVGVFPRDPLSSFSGARLPHARGGVSTQKRGVLTHSPVFPTHVGVFPSNFRHPPDTKSLPHARGGVSTIPRTLPSSKRSSPRTWGCFLRRDYGVYGP